MNFKTPKKQIIVTTCEFKAMLRERAAELRERHNTNTAVLYHSINGEREYYSVVIGKSMGAGNTLDEAIAEAEKQRVVKEQKRLIKLHYNAQMLGLKVVPASEAK